ncbi:uncharacterized protein TNCV_3491291 [Trichonephila clavipes]|nr:uncharacterized protein TNCV_3491291 [Trichonephila clavipes]
MEKRTGSLNSNSSRHESSSFESVQWKSNESQYGGKKGSGVKRELEEKGIRFKKDQGERHTGPERKQRKGQKNQGEKRQLTVTNNSELQGPRKKYGGDEEVIPSTSRHNRRPRNGTRVEYRPTIEMKTQQGGLV